MDFENFLFFSTPGVKTSLAVHITIFVTLTALSLEIAGSSVTSVFLLFSFNKRLNGSNGELQSLNEVLNIPLYTIRTEEKL